MRTDGGGSWEANSKAGKSTVCGGGVVLRVIAGRCGGLGWCPNHPGHSRSSGMPRGRRAVGDNWLERGPGLESRMLKERMEGCGTL